MSDEKRKPGIMPEAKVNSLKVPADQIKRSLAALNPLELIQEVGKVNKDAITPILEELGARLIKGKITGDDQQKKVSSLFKKYADLNSPVGQNYLGYCFEAGIGTVKNAKEAVRLYRLAAEQGNANAQINLAFCFANGKGVEKDEEEAVRLYRLLAERGNAYAQTNLALCYQHGIGVKQDAKETVRLYHLAAEQGNAHAQINLAHCYGKGEGVKQDAKEAVRLYRLAAEKENAHAQMYLALCYEKGQGVEKDEKEAVKLYRLAAEQGTAQAKANLAFCYQNGKGVERDAKEAVRLYRSAVEQGDSGAQNNLAVCYANGTGVKKDMKEAVRLFRLAAEQGNVYAQNHLANCYEKGLGTAKDIKEATKFKILAATQGHEGAQSILKEDIYLTTRKAIEIEQRLGKLWNWIFFYALASAHGQQNKQETVPKQIESFLHENQELLEEADRYLSQLKTPAMQELLIFLTNTFPSVLINLIQDYADLKPPQQGWFEKGTSKLATLLTFFSPDVSKNKSHFGYLLERDRKQPVSTTNLQQQQNLSVVLDTIITTVKHHPEKFKGTNLEKLESTPIAIWLENNWSMQKNQRLIDIFLAQLESMSPQNREEQEFIREAIKFLQTLYAEVSVEASLNSSFGNI